MARLRNICIVVVLLLTSCGYSRSEAVQEDGGTQPESSQGDVNAEGGEDVDGPPATALPSPPEIESKGSPADAAATITFADGTSVEVTFQQLDDVVQKTLTNRPFQALSPATETFDTDVLRQLLIGEVIDAELATRGVEITDALAAKSKDQVVTDISGAIANQLGDPELDRTKEAAKLIEDVPFLKLIEEVTVSEQALVASLEETAAPGDVPCVSHIQLSDEEAAKKVVEEVKGGADFGKLAAEKSEDTGSGQAAGALGCTDTRAYPPEMETVIKAAAVGEVADPVKTERGWHVILVTGTEKEDIEPLAFAQRESGYALSGRFRDAEITIDPKIGTWDATQNAVVPAA